MNAYLSIIIILQIFHISLLSDNLVFLYTHYRHGARGPTKLNDNYLDNVGEKWTELGELTGIGERMHYLLGLRNRKKYIEEKRFLSEKFDPHEMIIYSTDVNRTLISCASQMQGWYPQRANMGEILTPKQENNAYPPILEGKNPGDEYIEIAKNELHSSALPYRMILTPIRMISKSEKLMNLHDIGTCKEKMEKLKEYNALNNPIFKIYTDKFNHDYGKQLNKYYKEANDTFYYKKLKNICSDFICDYTDNRALTEFKTKTGINLDEFNEACLEHYEMYYKYVYHGDEEKAFAHVESSKLLREVLYYMKRRIDANMTEEDEDANYANYSIPRMLMISGHDTSVSADYMLLLKALGINETEKFKFPKFASQLALEVTTELQNCTSYSDYNITGYFDNNVIFNIKVDEFIKKVEKEIWSNEKVDEYCGFISHDEEKSDEKTDEKKEESDTNYKILIIIFASLAAILLAIIIVLIVKLSKSNKIIHPGSEILNSNNENIDDNGINNLE